jgi:predicted nucleotidyltransferase
LFEKIDSLNRLPKKVREELKNFCSSLKELIGNDLLGLLLYGSALRDDYIPHHSDINILVLVKEVDVSLLRKVAPLVARANQRALIEPLFLTPEYIKNSLDTFPLEYLDIKRQNLLLYGEDIFSEIEVDRGDLRLQVEREWKLNYIRLQQAYLRSYNDPEALKKIMIKSFNSFTHLLSAIYYLKDSLPEERHMVWDSLMKEFFLRKEIINYLKSLRERKEKIGKEEIHQRFNEYFKMMERIMFALEALRKEG